MRFESKAKARIQPKTLNFRPKPETLNLLHPDLEPQMGVSEIGESNNNIVPQLVGSLFSGSQKTVP